jgi:phage gp29-like protein
MPKTQKAYRAPSVRSFTTWTPALLRSALSTADGGHLRSLAELCDALLGDDRIAGVFETRMGGLLALTPSFEAAGDGRRKSRAVRALEADEDWWEIAPEDELYKILVWGRLLGIAPYQHAWKDHQGRKIPSIRFWHPSHLRWDVQGERWLTRISANGYDTGTEVEITPGDGQWGLYTPYGPDRPWASGLWRGLSRFWLLKSYAIDDSGRLGERAITLVGTTGPGPEGPNNEQREELAHDLYSLARDGAIVLPPACDAKLLEVAAGTAEIYQRQIEAANNAFAINVLGQNLTTEVTGGSFAAASVHGKVELQRLRADAQAASTTLHDQTLEWWAEFNYGDRKLAPWPMWPTDPPADNAAVVKTWLDFGAALSAFQGAGLRVDALAMAEKLGVPLLDEAAVEDTDPGSKDEREKKAAEIAEAMKPADPEPEGDDDAGAEDEDEAAPAARKAPAKARAVVALASGDSPRAAAGFIEGQTYADALTDRGQQRGAEALDGFLTDVDALLDGIDSLESAREKLLAFYDGAAAPEELAAMTEKLFLMSLRAGVGAVQQDAPEVFDGDR